MDDDLIRILPMGASDRLIEIAIVDGELDPKLDIHDFFQTSKRAVPAFVSQIDAHVGQQAETFDKNGEPGVTYTIKEVNEKEDTIVLVDETEGELKIEFNFTGIPLDEPFAVLRPRQIAAEVGEQAEQPPEDLEDADIFEDLEGEVGVEQTGLVERPVTQRVYPDIVQRNEMFQNLLEMLDPASQKNVKRQRDIRRLVEQFILLRNEVVKYSETGEPVGKTLTSYQTLAELLENTDIPLSRPVLDASRSVYLPLSKEGDNPTELPNTSIDVNYLYNVLTESNHYLDTQLGGTSGQIVTPGSLPQWYTSWETFFRRYMRTYLTNGDRGEFISFAGDKEFLRGPVTTGTEAILDGISENAVTKVRLSLLKGLGPRYLPLNEKEGTRKVESGDEGILMTQLLFPLSTQRDLGLSRSGRIMKDIAYSHYKSKPLLDILNDVGGIPEEATAGGIISIGEGGNTSGNIAIDDWLKVQPIRIRGLGDALVELKNLGMTQKELSVDQQEILIDKVKQYRALLKQHIASEREISAKATTDLRMENAPFLTGESLEDLIVTMESEPLINTLMEEIRKRIPAYKDNDLALVAGVDESMADLLLATLAGVPGPLARERNRCVRDQFLDALAKALKKADKKASVGEIPQPINCPHVESMNEVLKVKNDDDRMQLLSRLLARFRGVTKDNWITCSASPPKNPHNLMCYHTFLLLQEYLHPREKDTIHKELLLKFSGGVFQGKFMCKNCGQAISDLDLDQSMEFDDNGRPMANAAALVDTAVIAKEQVNMLIGESTEDLAATFVNDTQKVCYKAIRLVFDKLGIYAGIDTFKRLVALIESEVQKQPSREEYAKIMKAKKTEGRAVDYDVFLNQIFVSAIGAYTLIEIQTHLPEFVLRYKIPGCVAGFSGYPFGKEEDKTGINYISFAIAGIKLNEAPWGLSGFLTISQDKKRQDMIADRITGLIKNSLVKTAVVQQMISVKKAHNERVYGSSSSDEKIKEKVPAGFRPVPYYITAKEATEAIVIPEAAGTQELVRAWIQMGHRIARENGVYVRGSPFSETSCCYTPVTEPREFWQKKEGILPKLPSRTAPAGQSGSQVMLTFKPRPPTRLLADPPEELFYRVFLRVCYDGPRKGLPHQPGYTNTCFHCGFIFPENPYMVEAGPPLTKDLYKEWKSEMDSIITKGKTALESQRVAVNRSTFENILDATHTKFHIEMPKVKQPVTGTTLMSRLLELNPEPFQGFRKAMSETILFTSRMTKGPSEMDIAQAYAPLSDNTNETLLYMKKRIEPAVRTLQNLLRQSPTQVVESVRTYFLVPFQRLVMGFKPKSLKVLGSYDLIPAAEEDVNASLQSHLEYLSKLQTLVKGYTEIKLKQAQLQLSSVLTFIQRNIRPNLIPGGDLGTRDLVAALIVGVLGEFINPNIIPDGVTGTGGAIDTSSRAPLTILEVCLSRLELEGLNFTEEEIREMIARRTAAEKDLFTTRQNNMTTDEKKVDKMMKRYGIGDTWSIGGTAAVFTLNTEQYQREQLQRNAMGLGDFATNPDALANANALLQGDIYGGDGYDNMQTGSDDF